MYKKITRVNPTALSAHEIASQLLKLPQWTATNGYLRRNQIVLRDFETTRSLLNHIAMRSHIWGHHPELIMNYNKLDIKLTTHDIGSKISDIDLELAKRIEDYIEFYLTK